MKALVGIDGSSASYAAAQLTGKLLSPDRDEVTLFYSPGAAVKAGDAQNVSRKALLSKLTTAVFDRARQQLPAGLRNAKVIVSPHDPREGLQLAASDHRCDLLVVGAKGSGPLQSTQLGSVARYLAHQATIPLLIVRAQRCDFADELRVLLACDGTPTSRCATKLLGRFSWPGDAVGFAITVIEPTNRQQLPEWISDEFDDEQLTALGMGRFIADAEEESRRRKEVAKWFGQLPAIFANHAPLIVSGNAGEEILAAISARNINLAVVGARRRGPVRRLFLGSTSDYVVNHASCSVLIVRGVRGTQLLQASSPIAARSLSSFVKK